MEIPIRPRKRGRGKIRRMPQLHMHARNLTTTMTIATLMVTLDKKVGLNPKNHKLESKKKNVLGRNARKEMIESNTNVA
jgi:hypothetical protein